MALKSMLLTRRSVPFLLAALALFSGVARAAGFSARLSDQANKAVADAVISLTPLDAPVPKSAPAAGVKITQLGQQYRPYVTPVLVGTEVQFPNQDKVQHHLYSVSKAKPFEKHLYDSGASESERFDQAGVVTLGCNIHDWMIAYVVVLETPWFATSSDEGSVSIAGVQAGRYRVEIWHPGLPAVESREIVLSDEKPRAEDIRLKLKPERRPRRAPGAETSAY